jgi:hypothetical protein
LSTRPTAETSGREFPGNQKDLDEEIEEDSGDNSFDESVQECANFENREEV